MRNDKIFYERQIKRLKDKLSTHYSGDESNKSKHYFQQKGYYEGVLYAYESILDSISEDNSNSSDLQDSSGLFSNYSNPDKLFGVEDIP